MKKILFNLMAVAIAAVTFTACEDVPAPYDVFDEDDTPTIEDVTPAGTGTAADPYNVAAILDVTSAMAADEQSADGYYMKGYVVSIKEQYSTQYGNATFNIADSPQGGKTFTVYRALYFDNKKYTAGTTLNVGDEVVVYGKVVNYRGDTPETVTGQAYLISLNGETSANGGNGEEPVQGEAKGTGTEADPYNAVAVINYINSLGSDVESPNDVYIKGKIASITEEYSTQYGNGTFTISEDGQASSTTFTVYRALYLGNKKYTAGETQIKVGDEVVICGKVVNFRGNTPETVTGKAYLYSLNGATAGNGGENVNPTPGGDGQGTADNPYDVNAAIAAANGTGVYVKGFIVGSISGQVLASGAQFSATSEQASNILIAASADETSLANCMPVQLPAGAVRSAINLVDNPGNYKQEVILYGNIEKYFGATGLKSVTFAILNGNEIGTNPGGGNDNPTPSGDATGSGTQADPYNAPAAIAFAQSLGADTESANEVYVKGKISSIKYTYSAQYGTATYNISADGQEANVFTVYGSYYFNNQPWVDGNTQIQVGDEVVVCGKVVNYMGTTPEFSNKKNWLVSLNGKTE